MLMVYLVFKVLVLKMLLFSVATYEFGYHPSAEEDDSLMRETQKSWTDQQRQYESREPKRHPGQEVGMISYSFVPRYGTENVRRRPYRITSSHLRRPQTQGYTHLTHATQPALWQDQHSEANSELITFNMFSDEVVKEQEEEQQQQQNIHGSETSVFSGAVSNHASRPIVIPKRNVTTFKPNKVRPVMIHEVPLRDPVSGPSVRPDISENPSIPILYSNNSNSRLPIFFKNPATGIFYAITELGKLRHNTTLSNVSIPTYITQQEHERDLLILKKHYERGCRNISRNNIFRKPSGKPILTTTIANPQIIGLKKPSQSAGNVLQVQDFVPIHTGVKPTPSVLPSPVILKTELIIKDPTKAPSRRQTTKTKTKPSQKKKKKKKEIKKRPGFRSSTPATHKESYPKIVMGKRTTEHPTRVTPNRLSTQLENPGSLPITILSNFRSYEDFESEISQKVLTKPRTKRSNSEFHKERGNDFGATEIMQPKIKVNSTEKTASIITATTSTQNVTTTPEISINTSSATYFYPLKSKKFISHPTKELRKSSVQTVKSEKLIKKRKKSKKRKETKDDYDYFGLLDYDDDDGDDDGKNDEDENDEDENDDDEYEDTDDNSHVDNYDRDGSESNDDYYDALHDYENQDGTRHENSNEASHVNRINNMMKTIPIKYKINKHKEFKTSQSNYQSQEQYEGEELREDLKISQGNSSSAEEGVDYGALPELPYGRPIVNSEEGQEEAETYLSTKNSIGKRKRTHKRPSITRDGDYYDDEGADDDDDDGSSGIGGFFNMLLYPLQLIMDKLFDSGAEEDAQSSTDSADAGSSYTLYNNNPIGISKDENIEADEQQGNSLMDWFSSWLGFSRRTTKNIGGSSSSTPTVIHSISTEKPSGGWLGSWLNRGSSKTPTKTAAVASSSENHVDDDAADDDDGDGDNGHKWFFGWFDAAKSKRRQTTKTPPATTPTPLPQVPILTIVDPMRNPQNWIGILTNHIVNNRTTPSKQHHQRPLLTHPNPNAPRKINYGKYQIWRLKPQDDEQVAALAEYKRSDEGVKLQWLRGPSLRGLNDVLVPPRMFADFEATLSFESIAHEVLIFDVGKVIDYEKSHKRFDYYMDHSTPLHHHGGKKTKKSPSLSWSWNNYYEYNDIVKYLESLRLRYPQMIELLHIGRSYEGRPLIVVKIEPKQAMVADPVASASASASAESHKRYKFKRKSGHTTNAVFIEAGTHGVEWIGPATATWMINELLRIMKSTKSHVTQDLIRNTTWYILPVLNPDGYVYTHEYDRFWKKSRSRHISRPDDGIISSALSWFQQRKAPEKVCYGVDLDRNWRHQWGRRGSSQSPCNEFYAGPVPFSEPETKALAQFLMDHRKQTKLFVSLQAYGQVLSYSHNVNVSSFMNSDKSEDLLDVALVGTDGLRKEGSQSRYKIDSNSDLLEHRSGCSDAFAAFEVGIPFSYTLQLGDNGVHGYLLPSSSIEATARDAFGIITAMIEYI